MPNTINGTSTAYDTHDQASTARSSWLKTYSRHFAKASQPYRNPETGKWHFNFERADSTGD